MTGTVALVVAAGRGQRFGGELPKQYRRSPASRCCAIASRRFLAHPAHRRGAGGDRARGRARSTAAATAGLELLTPVAGGATRQESVRNGLESLAAMAPKRVLIHDAARPFIEAPITDRVLDALDRSAGAIAALPRASIR